MKKAAWSRWSSVNSWKLRSGRDDNDVDVDVDIAVIVFVAAAVLAALVAARGRPATDTVKACWADLMTSAMVRVRAVPWT